MGGVSAWREGEMKKRGRAEEWAREDRERAEREEDVISSDNDDDDEDEDDEDDEDEDAEDGKSNHKPTKLTPTQKARAKAEQKALRAASRALRLEALEARKEARALAKAEMADENEEFEAQGREAAKKADLDKGLIGGDDDVRFVIVLDRMGIEAQCSRQNLSNINTS